MKRCTACGEEKSLDAFGRDRSRRDGRRSRCRACVSVDDAARYAAKKAAGVCGKCSAPARPGVGLCEVHTAAQSTRTAARYVERKAAGLCCICAAAALPGKVYCETHAAANAARVAAYYADNLAKARAASAAAARKSREAAISEGRCAWQNGYGCQGPAEDGLRLCAAHRAAHRASNARCSARQTAAMLADAAEWDIYRCHLCGLDIEPGDEMDRDHIVPEKQGGADRCATTGTSMLRPAHAFCNRSRQDEHILVAVARLNPDVAPLDERICR